MTATLTVSAPRVEIDGALASDYAAFLESKRLVTRPSGIDVEDRAVHPSLFGFQRDLVRWSLRKGRAAVFAGTGLGKTRMWVEWARLTGRRTLALAPLGVAGQTVTEARKIGVDVAYVRGQDEAPSAGIALTNYELLDRFDPSAFGAVVLDESSILKHHDAKTRTRLIEAFRATPYRLACTATPAPNDVAELANHAEFLGVMSRAEMLATFFVHAAPKAEPGKPAQKSAEWRLRGHAREPFYRWLASWGMSLRWPSDLGYSDDGYILPPLDICPVIVPTDWTPPGQLFPTELKGITERADVRRRTVADRVRAAADLINAEPAEPWIVWVGRNDEGRELARLVPDALVVEGTDSPSAKDGAIERFISGEVRVIVSKVSIFGFGLNLQHCARMAFVGLSDSYEAYHQAIRRCWRFGQGRPVRAYVVLTEPEEPIYANVKRKEREFEAMTAELVRHVTDFERAEIAGPTHRNDLPHVQPMRLPQWLGGSA